MTRPLDLDEGDVIKATAPGFTGYDIEVTVTAAVPASFTGGAALVSTVELAYPLAVPYNTDIEVLSMRPACLTAVLQPRSRS
ncbi:hypothetical protein [Thermomonospora umbrina]|uniref:Uncharacterized protein n=1 Tax=Thermomonospora umbrina TaxID=111806 RepID=A0A3D9T2A8_9ACTN|nr:hypothetical protein [Thermomonospora umbrina]REF00494.1 hypothetical protein DFJ69_6038 [Thermomonospora umbrina]